MITNGIDENIAVILDDQPLTYYERNKPALLEYSHNYYSTNRLSILLKKKISNEKPEVKERRRQYMKGYYQANKDKFRK